jgi:hypothetical protein
MSSIMNKRKIFLFFRRHKMKMIKVEEKVLRGMQNTRWFKYDRDCLCENKSQFVPVIFEPPCNCFSGFVFSLVLKYEHINRCLRLHTSLGHILSHFPHSTFIYTFYSVSGSQLSFYTRH